jgi:hypothetical protein
MKEQRRFPRVRIEPALAEVFVGLGAEVTWPNQETSTVLDLSYKGVAARRPGLFPVAIANKLRLELRLGDLPNFATSVRVAWCNLDWVGMEFVALPAEGHFAMTEYMDYKLLGAGLKPVERAFFSSGAGFSHWFQGPSGTHVFVWMDDHGQMQKVQIDVAGRTHGIARGDRVGREERRSLLMLTELRGLPVDDFVRTLREA